MRAPTGSALGQLTAGQLALALAGVQLSALGDAVIDGRPESGCPEPRPGADRLDVPLLETRPDPAGKIPDGASVAGRELASVPAELWEAARAAALDEVALRAERRRSQPADLGGVLHGLGARSREEWVYLAVGALLHQAVGSPPGFYDSLGYVSDDGKPQALPDLGAIASRYLGLLSVARDRRLVALEATAAVAAARDSAELVAALAAYPVTA